MAESKSEADVSAAEQFAHDNRRRHARYQCRGFAEVIVDNACFLFRGSIRDISQTGCYIESQARLALKRGTEVELLGLAAHLPSMRSLPKRVRQSSPSSANCEICGDLSVSSLSGRRTLPITSSAGPCGAGSFAKIGR